MKYVFVEESWEDYLYWQQNDKKIMARINNLWKDISRNHYSGLGKPEPLKHKYQGFWSRRITEEHRLIYRLTKLLFLQILDRQIHLTMQVN